MSDRATSPVLGVVLLLGVTAALAGTVGSLAFGMEIPSDAPQAAIDLRVDADANRLTFVHRGGDTLDVTEVSIRVRVDGTPLAEPPPVPFFSATGFRPGPTGPFNSATDQQWRAGETASFELAGTNDPQISAGATVEVTIRVGETVVVEARETA